MLNQHAPSCFKLNLNQISKGKSFNNNLVKVSRTLIWFFRMDPCTNGQSSNGVKYAMIVLQICSAFVMIPTFEEDETDFF